MVRKQLKKIKYWDGRFLYLMISLVVVLITYSFFSDRSWHTLFSWFIGVLVLIAAIYADIDNSKHLILASSLGLSYFLFSILSLIFNSRLIFFLSSLSSVVFFTATVILIISSMLKKHEVTPNTIYGAISVYLLIGFIFSNVFTFVVTTEPSSLINVMNNSSAVDNTDALYYSYVTLTTLGFGDVVPANDLTRTFSVLEAIIGQLYLTILVAILISNFIPYRRKKLNPGFTQHKLVDIKNNYRKSKISKK